MDAKSEAYLGPYQTIKAGTYSYMTGKTNTVGIMIRLVNNQNKNFGSGQTSPFIMKTMCSTVFPRMLLLFSGFSSFQKKLLLLIHPRNEKTFLL